MQCHIDCCVKSFFEAEQSDIENLPSHSSFFILKHFHISHLERIDFDIYQNIASEVFDRKIYLLLCISR